MLFNRIFSKLTELLSANAKEPATAISTSPVVKPLVSEIAVEEYSDVSHIQGKHRSGNKARSRDEQRAFRGTPNKGTRRRELYLALEN